MSASIEQIRNILASRSKFVFTPTFIFCSPICPYNCGVVFFLKKHILFYGKLFFRSTTQICKFPPLILPELCDFALRFFPWQCYCSYCLKINTINHTGKLIEWRALIKIWLHALYYFASCHFIMRVSRA